MFYLIERDGKTVGAIEGPENIGALPWFHANVPASSMAHALDHEGYSVTELPEGPDCGDVSGILEAIAARVGLAAAFEFVPWSKSRNAKEKTPSLNWRVTLIRNGREVLATDYGQGCAHAPAYKAPKSALGHATSIMRTDAIREECETGRIVRGNGGGFYRRIRPPAFGDVLWSLLRDSDALDSGGFENWAADCGYDTDSRQAESIYRQCLEIGLKLQAAVGAATMAELRAVAAYN